MSLLYEQEYALEEIIDKHGLDQLLVTIACICQHKGNHLRCNWQDDPTARIWEKAGRELDKIAFRHCP